MKILVAGDYVPRNRLAPMVEAGQYEDIFGEVRNIVKGVDYAIVNFESPITGNTDIPIEKCGPNLHCPPKAVDALKYAGFNCVTLANNHIRDFGDTAVERTMSILSKSGMEHVGAGENIDDAARILFHHFGDITLAIINCCENEFSIASKKQYGANPLNPIRQYYKIIEAREKADYVMVIVHGGHEEYQLPSPRMQDAYRFFVDAGVDIVVNHHQHCYSGYEIYKGKPIVYGIGNFCMDKQPVRIGKIWNYGYMIIWDTEKPAQIQVVPYNQCGEEPRVHLLDEDAFDERLGQLNDIIADRDRLEEATEKYYERSMPSVDNAVEPFNNKYIAALRKRHLLPSFLMKKQRLKLQDYVLCESHRDKMEYYFKNKNNKQ